MTAATRWPMTSLARRMDIHPPRVETHPSARTQQIAGHTPGARIERSKNLASLRKPSPVKILSAMNSSIPSGTGHTRRPMANTTVALSVRASMGVGRQRTGSTGRGHRGSSSSSAHNRSRRRLRPSRHLDSGLRHARTQARRTGQSEGFAVSVVRERVHIRWTRRLARRATATTETSGCLD